jgi:hypothetical protein
MIRAVSELPDVVIGLALPGSSTAIIATREMWTS